MLQPNAIIEPLSPEECERVYYELSRYLGASAVEDLTRLFITQRELRKISKKTGEPE